MTHDTREAWLRAAVDNLRERYSSAGYPLPQRVQVSVGFPRAKRKAIGQCWAQKHAADEASHIFISPVLVDAGDVLSTLCHELVHAAQDCQTGHGAKFVKACKAL